MTILCCVQTTTIFSHWKQALREHICLHVKDAKTLYTLLNKKPESMVLLHYRAFDGDIEEILKPLYVNYPITHLMVLSDKPSYKEGKQLLRFQIQGYGNSRLSAIHLQQAIEVIERGDVWLYPEFMYSMINEVTQAKIPDDPLILETLTSRECEIAYLVSQGLTNKEIASQTRITEHTVKAHLRAIFEKLKVTDRLSLALLLR